MNKRVKAALFNEAGMLGRILVAVAAVGSLHGFFTTYVAALFSTVGVLLLMARLITLNDNVRIARELAKFREFMYAALFLALATGAFELGLVFAFISYAVFATLVAELLLLRNKKG